MEAQEGRVEAQRQGEKPRRGKRSGEYRSRVRSNIHRVETDSQSEQHSEVEGPCPLEVASGRLLTSRYRPIGRCASTPGRGSGLSPETPWLVSISPERFRMMLVFLSGSTVNDRASAALRRRVKVAEEDGGDGVSGLPAVPKLVRTAGEDRVA